MSGPVYLVTGGCGFLGRHLLRVLLEKEDKLAEIRVFDKHIDSSLNGLSTERTKVVVIQGNITDYSSVLEASRGADVVIHTASLVDVWHKVPESLIVSVNVTGTENVIKACVECGIQCLVYTSSMEVIGPNVDGDDFIRGNEDTPYKVKHTMAYPKSKAKAEKIVLEANGTKVKGGKCLYTCSLRPTGIYGEGHQLIKDFYKLGVQRGGMIIGGVPEDSEHGRVYAGTENVIKACVECGIQCLVYTSSMEVIGPNVDGDAFIRGNEDTPYKVKHTMAYPKSKAKAEKIVLEANGTKVKGGKCLYTCSLRPTGIYGEGHQLIKVFYKLSVKRGGLVVGGVSEDSEHGRVYAGNVAWMHVLAARALRESPQTVGGESFFCYDDSPYKNYDDFNMLFLSTFNFRKFCIPFPVLWFLAMLNDVLRWILSPFHNYTPLLNRHTFAVACTSFTVGTDKALRHFQYRPLYDWGQCRTRTQKWVDTFPLDAPSKSKL